jgi:alkylation response protein AidB-like acyl-CoA dehydrogenase
MAGDPCVDVPIVHVPPPALFALCIATVAIGIARTAVDDVTDLSHAKVPLLAHGPLDTNPLFQAELARIDTELSAARALLYDIAGMVWSAAASREELTLEQRARVRAAAVWVTERAAAATGVAFRWAGGSSPYAACPLQRRLRDVDVLAQHFLVRPDTLTTAGAVLAGHEPDVFVF